MVHSSDKGAETSPYSLDLCGQGKLKLAVDLKGMLEPVPVPDTLVYARPVGKQMAVGLCKLGKKLHGMGLIGMFVMEYFDHDIACAFLLGSHNSRGARKHLVTGNVPGEQCVEAFLGYMETKQLVPARYGGIGYSCGIHSL